ncbi:MAG: hypothetical protein PHG66_06630 [Candidatus Colwellbacteria bacterium]|nr:hypothetical protein [Candidatus Colwellbacteria bacterium]
MQKIATRLFTYASIAFGVIGILMVLTSPGAGEMSSSLNRLFEKFLMMTVFIILPSFALSVAGKYLSGRS